MAKSGSGGKRGSGGGTSIAKNVTVGGVVVDLTKNPLQYGNRDSTLTAQARAAIDDFEDKRRNEKIEYSRFVDANGKVIEDNKGSKTSVKASNYARRTAYAMTHIHPREDGSGQLGGTFSPGDIKNFGFYNQTVYRAAAAEGTYTIAKGAKFDGYGLWKHYSDIDKKLTAAYNDSRPAAFADYDKAVKDYKAGKISYAAVRQAYERGVRADSDNFNTLLVGLHNALLAGQKQFGYTYSLERNK